MQTSIEATYSYLKSKYNTSVIGKKEMAVNRGVKLGSFSPEILAKCNLKQQHFLSF